MGWTDRRNDRWMDIKDGQCNYFMPAIVPLGAKKLNNHTVLAQIRYGMRLTNFQPSLF